MFLICLLLKKNVMSLIIYFVLYTQSYMCNIRAMGRRSLANHSFCSRFHLLTAVMFSIPRSYGLPSISLNIVTISRGTPRHIPAGPRRIWPCKALKSLQSVFPTEKNKMLKARVCANCQQTHIFRRRQKPGRRNTPSQRPILRSWNSWWDGGDLLTFETFQLFRQVFFIPVFLVFQVFLKRREKGWIHWKWSGRKTSLTETPEKPQPCSVLQTKV